MLLFVNNICDNIEEKQSEHQAQNDESKLIADHNLIRFEIRAQIKRIVHTALVVVGYFHHDVEHFALAHLVRIHVFRSAVGFRAVHVLGHNAVFNVQNAVYISAISAVVIVGKNENFKPGFDVFHREPERTIPRSRQFLSAVCGLPRPHVGHRQKSVGLCVLKVVGDYPLLVVVFPLTRKHHPIFSAVHIYFAVFD